MCEQGERGNLIAASVRHGPHGDNEHNFLKSAVKYCLDNPLHAVGGGLSKFWGRTGAPPRGLPQSPSASSTLPSLASLVSAGSITPAHNLALSPNQPAVDSVESSATGASGTNFTSSSTMVPAAVGSPADALRSLGFIMCSGVRLQLPQPFSHHYPFLLHSMEYPGKPTWKMMNEEGVVFSDECSIFVRQVQTKTKTQISLRSMWDSRGSAAAPEWRGSGWLLHAVGDKRCRKPKGCHKGFS